MSDYTTIVITVDGDDYEVDLASLLISESIQLKKHTGLNRQQWYEATSAEEPEAIQFLVWLALKRAGKDAGRVGDIDADLLALNIRSKAIPEVEVADQAVGPTGSLPSDSD